MNATIRHDLTQLVKDWTGIMKIQERERLNYAPNHVMNRILASVHRQTQNCRDELIEIMKKNDGIDQCEQKLNDCLVQNYKMKKELASIRSIS